MRQRATAAILLGWFTVCPVTRAAQERVEHPAAGISLVRPAGWQTSTADQVQANRERTRLPDAELQRALVTRSALPVVVFTKYAEPHPGLNPSVQITLRQALPGTPAALLTGALATLRRAFPDLQITQPVAATQVAGLPAAQVRVTYTLRTTSVSAGVLSRLWLVPRGSLMFLIGMAGPPSGPDVSEEEFGAVLRSIRIDR